MKLNGMQVFGLSNFKIDKIRISLNPLKVEMVLSVFKLSAKAFYNLNWKLGPLDLKGKGESFATIDELKALVKLTGSYYLRNGVQYVKFDTVNVNVTPGKMRLRFDNLFNGQKVLEDIANDVINQNSHQIGREVFPQIERGMDRKILKVLNQFVEKASFAELFP